MSEQICCKECDSPSCKGCNIYILATALNRGMLASCIDENGTVRTDLQPIVYGTWVKGKIYSEAFGAYMPTLYCSACKHSALFETDYCQHCGAKMRKDIR